MKMIMNGTTQEQIALLEAQLAILRGQLKSELEIGQLWTAYDETQSWQVAAGTKNGYARAIKHLIDWMTRQGCRYVSDVDGEKAKAYLHALQSSIGASSYNNRLVLIKKIWRELAQAGKYNISADVWTHFGLIPRFHAVERHALTGAELRKLLAAADEDMKLLILIGAYTGMRPWDSATLKWENVDMEHKRLRVLTATRKLMFNIAPELYEALVEARKKATGEYVSERNARGASRVSERFGKLLDKCGIKRTEKDEKGRTRSVMSFHSLRHFAFGALRAAGMSYKDLVRVFGNGVMQTYIEGMFGKEQAA